MNDCPTCKNWYPDKRKLCPTCRERAKRLNLSTRMLEPHVRRVREGV